MSGNARTTHTALDSLHYSADVLVWCERSIESIADEIGRTPFYVYDSRRITERIGLLRDGMPKKLSVHYAMKANPMPEVVQHISKRVDGIDVASAGELKIALSTNTEPRNISFAGPGKRDEELAAAVGAGITINMESENEMRRIAAISEILGAKANVAVRINPKFELKTAGMKMGGRPSQFGIDEDRVPAVLSELKTLDLNFRGFHIFSGSQDLRATAVASSLKNTTELVLKLARCTELPIPFVNIGGGMGIPYFSNESPIDVNVVASAVDELIERLTPVLGDFEPIMELGRFLVGEAGIYVTRVVDIKESQGKTFAICDGGLHHHLAASGNFGQVLRKNYPVIAAKRTQDRQLVTVVGPLCTPLDLLGDHVELDVIEVGSLILVLQSGAYGRSASPADFLSHPQCGEILI